MILCLEGVLGRRHARKCGTSYWMLVAKTVWCMVIGNKKGRRGDVVTVDGCRRVCLLKVGFRLEGVRLKGDNKVYKQKSLE